MPEIVSLSDPTEVTPVQPQIDMKSMTPQILLNWHDFFRKELLFFKKKMQFFFEKTEIFEKNHSEIWIADKTEKGFKSVPNLGSKSWFCIYIIYINDIKTVRLRT